MNHLEAVGGMADCTAFRWVCISYPNRYDAFVFKRFHTVMEFGKMCSGYGISFQFHISFDSVFDNWANIWNVESRPGKVMESRKMYSAYRISDFYLSVLTIVLTQWSKCCVVCSTCVFSSQRCNHLCHFMFHARSTNGTGSAITSCVAPSDCRPRGRTCFNAAEAEANTSLDSALSKSTSSRSSREDEW